MDNAITLYLKCYSKVRVNNADRMRAKLVATCVFFCKNA